MRFAVRLRWNKSLSSDRAAKTTIQDAISHTIERVQKLPRSSEMTIAVPTAARTMRVARSLRLMYSL
jgi:hypothetical protein